MGRPEQYQRGHDLYSAIFVPPFVLDAYRENLVLALIGEVLVLRLLAKPSAAAAASDKGPKVKFRLKLWLRSSSPHVAQSHPNTLPSKHTPIQTHSHPNTLLSKHTPIQTHGDIVEMTHHPAPPIRQ